MDDRFYKGIEEFNAGRYFEAHEVLEDLWHEYRDNDRTFLQGLIQLSAGFYHAQCANWKGAVSQLRKAAKKLDSYRPEYFAVDVDAILGAVNSCLMQIESATTTESALQPGQFPKLSRNN